MKTFICAFVLLPVSILWARECPQFTGKYRIQVDETPLTLDIHQTQCQSFTFDYQYGSGDRVIKTYLPNGQTRVSFNNGDKKVLEKAELVPLSVGGKYHVVALKVWREERHKVYGSFFTESYFYFESNENSSPYGIIERRDTLNAQGKRIRRVYLGFAKQ
ncbi:MAG: hypothetical protein D6797_00520 [Bdellovibrio sp.]|nr:MAG: hypothetical protein D6797_00520 [Bdellovibrio sp.]